jgi:hypothetical protein
MNFFAHLKSSTGMSLKFLFFLLLVLFKPYLGAQLPPCFSQIESEFFNYTVVAQAFANSNVQQSSWQPIYNQLQQNVRYVPAMVEQAAAQMNPNPLNPFQPLVAAELLRRVLYKIFHDTVIANSYLITNRTISESDINLMFMYIRAQQSNLFSACFGEQSEASMRVTE